MRYRITCILVILSFYQLSAQQSFTRFVNPFIGTGGHGHTYPGATMPHGMVQLSPDTRLSGWDGCGGYHYSDSFIYGFSHTHLSGTGVSDYGDILVMPMIGNPSPDNKIYGSSFDHASESASPGYYSVKLNDGDIFAELTTTLRTGFHSYTFPASQNANIILDLQHRDQVQSSSIKIISATKIEGHRRSTGWARDQHLYFVIGFSKSFNGSGIWKDNILQQSISEAEGKNLKAFFRFTTTSNEKLYVKVGISSVSIEGARKNLEAEVPGWDFTQVRRSAEIAWERELSKIEVVSDDENKKRIFYTALYHTMVVPNLNMDVDRQYRGRDNKIHTSTDFTNYSVFSLWDTYRAAHPLYTIIDQARTLDYIKTFLAQYQQGGRLPVWELSSNETDCMIGYHSVPVIVDAAVKGIFDFDKNLALEAMMKSANWNHLGLPALIDHGYIGTDEEHESVSKTLEYSYDDWCIARFAELMGEKQTSKIFTQRAQYYKNLLDPITGFIRPRRNGNWLLPFDPREVNNNYTEANGWQYNFYVPHDVEGYTKMIGGKKRLEEKLDSLFAEKVVTGRQQSDITGLIGQYAHGNEPSHHIAYMYNFAGKPHKTQDIVKRIMNEMYHDSPDGLSGNEDCGQMSAWYVFSALGFYPVTPASGEYITGIPLFSQVKLNLENGKTFYINQINSDCGNPNSRSLSGSRECLYSSHLEISGKTLRQGYISHKNIMDGGYLNFIMTVEPPAGEYIAPSTSVTNDLIVTNPVIDGDERSFSGKKEVSIYSTQPNTSIFYTTNGAIPGLKSKRYSSKFSVDTSCVIKAIAVNQKNQQSLITSAIFTKRPNSWNIILNSAYEPQYSGGGPFGLIDGIRGTGNWRMGNWQGYQGNNVDIVIDLGEIKKISEVDIGLLQDTPSWIVLPKEIIVETSIDNKTFEKRYAGKNFLPVKELATRLINLNARFSSVPARYVRVKAVQFGKLPAWHEGAGGDTHIFIDEILIK